MPPNLFLTLYNCAPLFLSAIKPATPELVRETAAAENPPMIARPKAGIPSPLTFIATISPTTAPALTEPESQIICQINPYIVGYAGDELF
jgi:hypothetical protein